MNYMEKKQIRIFYLRFGASTDPISSKGSRQRHTTQPGLESSFCPRALAHSRYY